MLSTLQNKAPQDPKVTVAESSVCMATGRVPDIHSLTSLKIYCVCIEVTTRESMKKGGVL